MDAFLACSNLKKIVIPSTVEEISAECFSKCYTLEEVVLNEGLKKIGEYAFSDCLKLKRIAIPSTANIKLIEKNAFDECGIKYVDYQSLNIEFFTTIDERIKKENRVKNVEHLGEIEEITQKLLYFGKCKLRGINYKEGYEKFKKEYEEFIDYCINTYSIYKKDAVSLDKSSCLKKQENKENKLIPWYAQCIPGFIIQKDDENVLDNKSEKIENLEEAPKYNSLPNIIDDKYYNIGNNLYIKGENGEDDDIMPKPFVKEFIKKINK